MFAQPLTTRRVVGSLRGIAHLTAAGVSPHGRRGAVIDASEQRLALEFGSALALPCGVGITTGLTATTVVVVAAEGSAARHMPNLRRPADSFRRSAPH